MKASITFAIPFHKGKKYLKQAIESTLVQTRSDWALIVVDDCGPEDGVKELVESYCDARLRYFRNEKNLGLAGNWNKCISLAQSEYVTLLHQDDVLLPNYMEMMLGAFKKYPNVSAVFCMAGMIDKDGRSIFSFPDLYKKIIQPHNKKEHVLQGENAAKKLAKGNFIICPTLCYHREKIKDLTFNSRWKIVLDWEYSLNLLIQGHSLLGIPDTCYRYRRHSQSESSKATFEDNKQLLEESAFLDIMSCHFLKKGWTEASKVAQKKKVVKYRILYYCVYDFLKFRWRALFEKMSLFMTLSNKK